MFWEWLSINSWIFWLPALAIAIATVLILRKHRSRDLRSKITLKSIPRWAIFVMIPVVITTIALISDSLIIDVIQDFFFPSQYKPHWVDIPVLTQAITFSLIGIPLILQGLAFGWLRRLFTSAVHCPKCKYDLASIINRVGELNTICPECGFTPSSEQPVSRLQKRRRLIVAGVLIALYGLGLSGYRAWQSGTLPKPAWFVSMYTSLTGRMDLWYQNPQTLSESVSLKLFNQYWQPIGNPAKLPPIHGRSWQLIRHMTNSRSLEQSMDAALAKLALKDQLTLLDYNRRLLVNARTSITRQADAVAGRLILDDLLERFLDDSGSARMDLDLTSLIETFRDKETPSISKAFILRFVLPKAPASFAIELLRREQDPVIRNWIVYRSDALQPTRHESFLDRFSASGGEDALFELLVRDLLYDDSELEYRLKNVMFASDAEFQLIDILESDTSPIFTLPLAYADDPVLVKSWYTSRVNLITSLSTNSTSPLARARWQILINELNRLANQAAPPPAPADPTPSP